MSEGWVLAVNAGSSSLKLGLFEAGTGRQIADEAVSWGDGSGDAGSHDAAFAQLLARLPQGKIAAVGHRVVQGGTELVESVLIDDRVTATIARLAPLAPLHNPAALDGIAAVTRALPGVPQVAAFDTAFHATLPPRAYHYPVPYAWYQEWGIRRLGFHGLSHAYCAGRAVDLLGSGSARRIVSCHLGQGCSVTAIQEGRSVATSMGFTPMDGVMMGTRSGAIDPGILHYLIDERGLAEADLHHALNHESGLKGVSGLSGDMRQILQARQAGHPRAALAFDLFITRLCEGIAMMVAALEGLDGLIFTAGIGEHAAEVRAEACRRLDWLGVTLDPARNEAPGEGDRDLSPPGAPVRVLVIHTREDLMVARETLAVLDRPAP